MRNTALGASAVSLGVSSHLLADGNNDAAAAAIVGVGFAVVSGLAEMQLGLQQKLTLGTGITYRDQSILMPDKLEPTYSFKISEVYRKRQPFCFPMKPVKLLGSI